MCHWRVNARAIPGTRRHSTHFKNTAQLAVIIWFYYLIHCFTKTTVQTLESWCENTTFAPLKALLARNYLLHLCNNAGAETGVGFTR